MVNKDSTYVKNVKMGVNIMKMYLKSRCPHWGKKITLLVLLLVLGLQIGIQASENKEYELSKRHEIKLDVAYLLFAVVKAEYEFILTPWSSTGVVGFIDLNSGDRVFKAQALGLYRLYFGKKPNTGLFLESNLGVTTGTYKEYSWTWDERQKIDYTAFGVGLALGWKHYIPQSGIVLDIFGGLGRFWGDYENPEIYPRVGICIGKRF